MERINKPNGTTWLNIWPQFLEPKKTSEFVIYFYIIFECHAVVCIEKVIKICFYQPMTIIEMFLTDVLICYGCLLPLTLSTHLVRFHPLQAVRGEMVQRMVKMGGTLDHRACQF